MNNCFNPGAELRIQYTLPGSDEQNEYKAPLSPPLVSPLFTITGNPLTHPRIPVTYVVLKKAVDATILEVSPLLGYNCKHRSLNFPNAMGFD